MKKILLFIFASFSIVNAQAQCNPDTTLTSPGIFPPGATVWDSVAALPNGVVGMPYSEISQMVAPSDTVIDTMGLQIPATVDSIWLLNFKGLPSSLSAVCNTSDCFISGGESGCFTISGTPTAADVGFHLIEVETFGYVTVVGLGTLSDTMYFLMSIDIQAGQAIGENVLSKSIKVNPNPINTVGYVSFEVPDAKDYTFEIIDLTGKKILSMNGVSSQGQNKIKVNKNDLAEGLYFYALHWNGISHKGRMMFVD